MAASTVNTCGAPQDTKVDPAVLAVLPPVLDVLEVKQLPGSRWANLTRIVVRHEHGSEERYFLKTSTTDDGLAALRGEFHATSAIHALTPDFCPRPIACGTLRHTPDTHFYLCLFHDFSSARPSSAALCAQLARLHLRSRDLLASSPSASHSLGPGSVSTPPSSPSSPPAASPSTTPPQPTFGFPLPTYNGNLRQPNTWHATWEASFAHGLRSVLAERAVRAGASAALDALLPALFDRVIPRLLRPMESHGRRAVPVLVHGDLWGGNVAVLAGRGGEVVVFDPAGFWGHNEYDLGNWRPERNGLREGGYFEAYHALVERTEPVGDYDDRNALYAVRFNLNAATLFPEREEFLQMAIDEIRRLVEKYPDGYTGQ